ncbi:MAG: hypothetical protein UT39_C0022G0002 [Candidatus Woesebacteria bacterium GW2011_GWA1_39_21]|uniref:Uncharacterized protein n=1 Tax=Candidatus Woesebacteria bacterium GW2011_GWA1_39_21 TaxID=1618550 RepID=A0A0G0N439_9BACT|nr:MAG: hypothetical protein UT39_C0022G0002 [Candidatus Woesebacteria bacterium GW2011_GWA1_39_21]
MPFVNISNIPSDCGKLSQIIGENKFLATSVLFFLITLYLYFFLKGKRVFIVTLAVGLSFLLVHIYIMYLYVPFLGKFMLWKPIFCM